MKCQLFFILLLFSAAAAAQPAEEQKIRQLLATQTEAWNRGDIEGFMQTYWKSDSLMFIGKNGVSRGWQKTLENYKKLILIPPPWDGFHLISLRSNNFQMTIFTSWASGC